MSEIGLGDWLKRVRRSRDQFLDRNTPNAPDGSLHSLRASLAHKLRMLEHPSYTMAGLDRQRRLRREHSSMDLRRWC